jgi:NAD-dependent SIR2 family protein deacetylase
MNRDLMRIGPGISRTSGIPNFRAKDQLWKEHSKQKDHSNIERFF